MRHHSDLQSLDLSPSTAQRRLRRPDLVVLNDVSPELGRRTVTEGRPLFVAVPEAEHAFRRDVQLLAADLDPFLRRTRAIKLERLRRHARGLAIWFDPAYTTGSWAVQSSDAERDFRRGPRAGV